MQIYGFAGYAWQKPADFLIAVAHRLLLTIRRSTASRGVLTFSTVRDYGVTYKFDMRNYISQRETQINGSVDRAVKPTQSRYFVTALSH